MDESRQHILDMLSRGQINAEEADLLLSALPEDEESAGREMVTESRATSGPAIEGEVITPTPPPDIRRFRHYWRLPFIIAVGALTLSTATLLGVYQASAGRVSFGFVCLSLAVLLAALATTITFVSRNHVWLHLRIQPRQGRRIALSLPLPFGVARVVLSLARFFVNEGVVPHLENAQGLMSAMQQEQLGPDAQPIVIQVDDEDGDQVLIYIG